MIFPLITLIQNYSYDNSKILSYYRKNVIYSNCVYTGYKYYNYRSLPDTVSTDIYSNTCSAICTLPKRYIYSDMHK